MFDKNIEQKSNGMQAGIPPMSASDQKIEYRPFASAMKVTIDGEEFTIRPPSFHVSNIIKRFKFEHIKQISQQREVAVEISRRLDLELKTLFKTGERKIGNNAEKTDKMTEQGNAASSESDQALPDNIQEIIESNVDAVLKVYDSMQAELFKMQEMTDKEMFRLIQLIILDGKDKSWRAEYETFPPDNVLEKAIPFKRLYVQADIVELHVVLDVFNQMNKPEYARKNFRELSPLV